MGSLAFVDCYGTLLGALLGKYNNHMASGIIGVIFLT